MEPSVVVRWVSTEGELHSGGLEQLPDAKASAAAWVDVLAPDLETMDRLASEFGLHPLAVEDVLHYPQRPKVDLEDGAVFVVWVVPELRDGRLISHELDVFVGPRSLITAHQSQLAAIDGTAQDAAALLPRGIGWTVHSLLDRAVDELLPVVDRLGDDIDDLEDRMLKQSSHLHLEELTALRRLLLQVHRVIAPERDVLRVLAREEALVSPETYRYLQDVGDHLARAEDAVEVYRDVASGAMDIYLSSVSNRLNEVMKQLTVVATIFMSLTLIAGIYGMNFRHMPELTWQYGYPMVLLAMLSVAFGMFVYFRRKDWW